MGRSAEARQPAGSDEEADRAGEPAGAEGEIGKAAEAGSQPAAADPPARTGNDLAEPEGSPTGADEPAGSGDNAETERQPTAAEKPAAAGEDQAESDSEPAGVDARSGSGGDTAPQRQPIETNEPATAGEELTESDSEPAGVGERSGSGDDVATDSQSAVAKEPAAAGGDQAELGDTPSGIYEPGGLGGERVAADGGAAAADGPAELEGEPATGAASAGVSGGVEEGDASGGGEDWAFEPAVSGELVPVLWSEASPLRGILAEVPHWPVVTGRLHLALAVVLHTRLGAASVHYLTYEQIGEHSFDALMAEACDDLTDRLTVDVEETPDGELFSLSGTLVAAAVCVPAFHRLLAEFAAAERLLVGIVSPDLVYVAPDGEFDDMIEQLVLGSEHDDTELVPCVVRVTEKGVEFVSERPTSSL
jgi:hypothetical protein